MIQKPLPVNILIADDDPDDRYLAQSALDESRLKNKVFFVSNGEELLDFLHNRNNYASKEEYPTPDLILLDLNMPKKSGIEALTEIRNDPELKHLPVIILTTSEADQDIMDTYRLGVNSFITKPISFEGLVDVMKVLKLYWFQIVKLPNGDKNTITK